MIISLCGNTFMIPGNRFCLYKMIDGLIFIASRPSGNQECLLGNHNIVSGNRDGVIILIADQRVINISFPDNHFRCRDGLAGCRKTEIRLRISLIAEVCVNDILLCINDFGLRNREIGEWSTTPIILGQLKNENTGLVVLPRIRVKSTF